MCEFKPKNRGSRMDPCMKGYIDEWNLRGHKTVACCCGHGKYPPTIVEKLPDGRFREIMSGEYIPRSKKFYKRDAEGYYYIPEAVQ